MHADLNIDDPHVWRYTGRKFSWVNNPPGKTKQFTSFAEKRQDLQEQRPVKKWMLSPIQKLKNLNMKHKNLRLMISSRWQMPIKDQIFAIIIALTNAKSAHRYVPEVEVTDLSNIILETIASLNEINPLTGRLIQIARDGKISDDEIKDFAYISKKLDEISLAIDSLNLWVDKTAGEQGLNLELLNVEKEKLK